MATVKEVVKESLVGTTREPELSQEIRATFNRNSRLDEVSGERYMTEEEFVNAIAPIDEDYVRTSNLPSARHLRPILTSMGPNCFLNCSIKSAETSTGSSFRLPTVERLDA